MTETTVAYKAVFGRTGIYIQEEQVEAYIKQGYTVYKITTEVCETEESEDNESEV